VIEALSGQRYEEYVCESVLKPSGITAMKIGDKSSDRKHHEVAYFGPGDPYRLDPQRMDSHGGWIASPTDLVNFALHVDRFPSPPDILLRETEQDMIKPSEANPNYAKGWCINSAGNWWHNGRMPGTSSILVRTASGMCWAGITNNSPPDVDLALDRLLWKMARCVPSWAV
jgi:CubicO group peptidase (beta-lactamase class C family)